MKKKKEKNYFPTIIIAIIVLLVLSISIGWASISMSFYIDSSAIVRINADTRITGFQHTTLVDSATSNGESYSKDNTYATIYLPEATSTVTFQVVVTNMELDTGVNMGIKRITGLPNNLEIKSYSGYSLENKLCDDNDATDCGSGSQKTFSITIGYVDSNSYDEQNLEYSLALHYDFKEVFDITYTGFTNPPSSPVTFMEGDTPSISLVQDAPSIIAILCDGVRLEEGVDYSFSSYVITFLTDIDADLYVVKPVIHTITYVLNGGTQANNQVTTFTSLNDEEILPATKEGSVFKGWFTRSDFSSSVITSTSQLSNDVTLYAKFYELTKAYFMEYNGNDTSIFGLSVAKTQIKSFSRKTNITKSEAQALSNNYDASSQSGEYISIKPIYMWVEGNSAPYDLYWWSEANEVYFNPKTKAAFSHCSAIVTIDLTGTNTSEVENFSQWFDTDILLTTITGTIVTSGVTYSEIGTFDYAGDASNDTPSGNGMSFMFNDCKKLNPLDVSGFDTSNVVDMKRMFAGCEALQTIDVSSFDTSKVRSMYWMFRKTLRLSYINLSSFNTSNVENMRGMFAQSKAQEIAFGPGFVDKKLYTTVEMFSNAGSLTLIKAYNDLNGKTIKKSTNMFNANNAPLVGAAGTDYEFAFNSSNQKDKTFARICTSSSNQGYFTHATEVLYPITYDLGYGGTANNPSHYGEADLPITLNAPTREGFEFLGWTTSTNSTIQPTVTIPVGTEGALDYIAKYRYLYTPSEELETIFAINGTCQFNGSTDNITGTNCVNAATNADYTTGTYIETGINLFSSANYYKDFEISFKVNSFVASEQESGNAQQTLINMKLEDSSAGYPGLVVRRNNNALEIKLAVFDSNKGVSVFSPTNKTFKIVRHGGILFYSINGGNYYEVLDFRKYSTPCTFTETLILGAARNGNGTIFRNIKATISNFQIKLEGD